LQTSTPADMGHLSRTPSWYLCSTPNRLGMQGDDMVVTQWSVTGCFDMFEDASEDEE